MFANTCTLALFFVLLLCCNYRHLRYMVVSAEDAENLFLVTWDYNGIGLSFYMDIPIPEGEKGVDEVCQYHCGYKLNDKKQQEDCAKKLSPLLHDMVNKITKVRRDDFNSWISILEKIGLSDNEIKAMKTQITQPIIAFMEKLRSDPVINTRDRPIRILEIGSARGGSAMWFTHNLLPNHPDSQLICIDAWTVAGNGLPNYDIFKSFQRNVASFEHYRKVRPLRADSLSGVSLIYSHYYDESRKLSVSNEHDGENTHNLLFEDWIDDTFLFDIVYIDGAHSMVEVLSDGLLTIPMLRPGGYLIFDDYTCNPWLKAHERVKEAVDAVMESYADQFDTIQHKSRHQVAIFKKKSYEQLDALNTGKLAQKKKQSNFRFGKLQSIIKTLLKSFPTDTSSPDNPYVILEIGYYSSGFTDFIASLYHQEGLHFLVKVIADYSRDLDSTSLHIMTPELDEELQVAYTLSINSRLAKLYEDEGFSGKVIDTPSQMNSKSELTRMVTFGNVLFSLIYFDGRGSYAWAMAELSLAFRLLTVGGLLILDTSFTQSFNKAYTVFTTAFTEHLIVLDGQDLLDQGARPSPSTASSSTTFSVEPKGLIILRKTSMRFRVEPEEWLFQSRIEDALASWSD